MYKVRLIDISKVNLSVCRFCKPLILFEERSNVDATNKDNVGTDAITWKIPKAQKSTPILKRLFAQFIKEIVEGMIRYVRLPSIMAKLLADNGSQEFGDFKLTILGMLGTYGFERRILVSSEVLLVILAHSLHDCTYKLLWS